jgi:ATP-dependent helicase HrpA
MSSGRTRRSRNRSRSYPTNEAIRQAERKLNQVFLFDRDALRNRLYRLKREYEKLLTEKRQEQDQAEGAEATNAPKVKNQQELDWDKRMSELLFDCDASVEKVAQRRAAIPEIHYPSDLPIVERKDEIKKLIAENQVVVVCGETGSGKSTQLPKMCLELGLGARGMIGHTQPRRIAARSIAQRVADELQTPLGQGVGYKIRFSDETSESTYVKLMTDGILLAESQSDRFFNRYEVLIVDEAQRTLPQRRLPSRYAQARARTPTRSQINHYLRNDRRRTVRAAFR